MTMTLTGMTSLRVERPGIDYLEERGVQLVAPRMQLVAPGSMHHPYTVLFMLYLYAYMEKSRVSGDNISANF